MKVYIVCICHPTCFIQHANPFALSFNVKSKVATDIFLPVILSKFVDSNDEKPRRGKTWEWIKRRHQLGSVQNIIKELIVEDRYAFSGWHLKICFGWVWRTSKLLGRWSEFSSLLFKLISIWCVSFFYCYNFAERFSFVESFEIRSSNIRNGVIRMKYWMNNGINRSNMKIVLDKPENVGWKICSRSNFHPTRFFFMQHDFFFVLLFFRSVKPIQHFIQHGIFVMLDEMLGRFNKAFNTRVIFKIFECFFEWIISVIKLIV